MKLICQKFHAISAVLLLLYPIVPTLAYIVLLWAKPKKTRLHRLSRKLSIKNGKNGLERQESGNELQYFQKFQFYSQLSQGISGGIESPIQFTLTVILIQNTIFPFLKFFLQLWLFFMGKIPKPWDEHGTLRIKDAQENTIILPTTAAISMIFSLVSMLKSIVSMNIFRVHIDDVDDSSKVAKIMRHIMEHLPFFAASIFFRLSSIALFLTYWNNIFGMLPILGYWIINLYIGYRE